MSKENDNRRKALADVASLEAWHTAFSGKSDRADLFVDVAFKTGRVGGSATDDIRFRLRLKRAQVVILSSPNEPVKLDPATVTRDSAHVTGEVTETISSDKSTSAEGEVAVSGGLSSTSAAARGVARGAASKKTAISTKVTETFSPMRVTQSQNSEGDYIWEIEPVIASTLQGKPWVSHEVRRVQLIDTRTDRTRGIAPTISVELRCLREDLEITDIVTTDESLWSKFKKGSHRKNKLAAAEAVIRTRLFESGLISGDLSNPFAEMTLSAVIAQAN